MAKRFVVENGFATNTAEHDPIFLAKGTTFILGVPLQGRAEWEVTNLVPPIPEVEIAVLSEKELNNKCKPL